MLQQMLAREHQVIEFEDEYCLDRWNLLPKA